MLKFIGCSEQQISGITINLYQPNYPQAKLFYPPKNKNSPQGTVFARQIERSRLQAARNQLFHDLVGAAIDPMRTVVDIGTRDRILHHKAIATVQLYALIDHVVDHV